MPPTVPATAPTVPPTTAPTGPAARAPASAPSAAPRTVPCACAATGSAMIAARVAAARIFVFIGRSMIVEEIAEEGDLEPEQSPEAAFGSGGPFARVAKKSGTAPSTRKIEIKIPRAFARGLSWEERARRLSQDVRRRNGEKTSTFGLRGIRAAAAALRRNPLVGLARLEQHVAAAPDGLDVVLAGRRVRQLLAQLADEHVDDLELRLVHAAVEMIEEHLLGERRPFAQGEQLEHLIFLAGQVHALAADLDRLGVEIDDEIAGVDDRLGVALGAADDRVDARDQLVLVERLGHVVVGAEAEALDLVLNAGEAGEDQDRRLDLRDAYPD